MTVQINHHFIHITPAPTFGRIICFDDGMADAVKVLCGVLAAGLITTADMSAGPTDAKMKPLPPQPKAFLAALGAWCDLCDGTQVGTKIILH